MLNKIAFKVALAGLMASLSGTVSALENQWYLGIGGGISQLQPDTDDTSVDVDDKNGQVATVFIGRDFDNRSSGQFQFHSLGEAEYSDGQGTASYTAGDASLLYRFYDSRDRRPRGTIFGTSFYGRFGFGFMHRDSDLSLDTDTPVYFGAGAGIETYLTFNLAMRLEALFHDTDSGSATFTLVSRFGGQRRRPTAPPPVVSRPATPEEQMPADASEPVPLATLEPLDPEDTAVTSITVQESAVAVPTDLPETYDIPATISPPGLPGDTLPQPGVIQPGVIDNDAVAQLPEPLTTNEQAGAGETADLPPDDSSEDTDPYGIPEVEVMTDAESDSIPEVEILGTTTETPAEPDDVARPQTDSDADGVLDDEDRCPDSTPGYPVNARGCPAFGGMLPNLTFNDRTADLANSSYEVLDELVQQLNDFPTTYIEIVAHTDNLGTEAEQSELTRQRLRSIGVYLVRHGISQDRLLLRSYGGSRPMFDNSTTEGRRRNNRIEVFENP